MASQQHAGPGSPSGLPLVAQRYEVLPASRVAELDSPHAEAYQARDIKSSDHDLIALVCERDVLPRIDMLDMLARSDRGSVLRPLGWQVLDWPPAGAQRFVIVVPRPGGERLAARGATALEVWKPDSVVRRLIQPLLPFLKETSEAMVAHRAIRHDNLFHSEPGGGVVVLGEGVTGPPGMDQDAIYETIENGMAAPGCRGAGGPPDDLYALGALLVVLLTGQVPCGGMAAKDIVAAKLRAGSYGALAGRSAIPLAMTEPLRGLLCDDPKERWTVKDLEYWVGGRSLTPKQPALPRKASRPFRFADEEYLDARSLAHAMAHDWARAAEALKGEELVEWVRRSLGLTDTAELISDTLRLAMLSSAGSTRLDDRHVARILVIIDPKAPLRYRNLAVNQEALGRALVTNPEDADWRASLDELMRCKLPLAWLDAQASGQPELVLLRKRIEDVMRIYDQDSPGLGVERCLYTLEPNSPCQSGILRQDYVIAGSDLLPALERVAMRGPPEGDPMDRHIAAHCASHVKDLPEHLLSGLARNDPRQLSLATARLLAEVQRRTGPARLPALAGWLAERLRPLIGTFHHRPYRQELDLDIGRVVARGVLGELCGLLDNEAIRQADERGFRQAAAEHKAAASEIAWLEQGGLFGPRNVHLGSRHAASVVSSVCAGLLLVVITLVHWFK